MVEAGQELCIGAQNLMEFWVVATRPVEVNGLGLSPLEARAAINDLLASYTVLRDPPDLLERWLELCTRYAVSGRPAHDARLVALMLAHGVTHVLTLNSSDFTRYVELTCLTPEQV